MDVVCAWCGNRLSSSSQGAERETDVLISHGMCPECAENFSFQSGVSLQEYVESFQDPIVILGRGSEIVSANARARELMPHLAEGLVGCELGQVFECARARKPGACNNQTHCSGCVIRRAIEGLRRGAESFACLPALRRAMREEGRHKMDMVISAVRVRGIIMLRLQPSSMVPGTVA